MSSISRNSTTQNTNSKMKLSDFQSIVHSVGECLQELPEAIPISKRQEMEEQILLKDYFVTYDPTTHGGSYQLYENFLKTQDLKWIWCNSGNRYGLDPRELYNIAPDRCPVFGTLLDYGLGKNTATHHPAFRPSLDHIEQQSRGGNKNSDVNNFAVISRQANTFRNNATLMQMLYVLKYEIGNTKNE